MTIIWSEKAAETFQERIDYLIKHWTKKELDIFLERVSKYLETLSVTPSIARKSYKTKNTHIGLIIKEVSLIYRYNPKSQVIELVAFIDNRQSPRKTRRLS